MPPSLLRTAEGYLVARDGYLLVGEEGAPCCCGPGGDPLCPCFGYAVCDGPGAPSRCCRFGPDFTFRFSSGYTRTSVMHSVVRDPCDPATPGTLTHTIAETFDLTAVVRCVEVPARPFRRVVLAAASGSRRYTATSSSGVHPSGVPCRTRIEGEAAVRPEAFSSGVGGLVSVPALLSMLYLATPGGTWGVGPGQRFSPLTLVDYWETPDVGPVDLCAPRCGIGCSDQVDTIGSVATLAPGCLAGTINRLDTITSSCSNRAGDSLTFEESIAWSITQDRPCGAGSSSDYCRGFVPSPCPGVPAPPFVLLGGRGAGGVVVPKKRRGGGPPVNSAAFGL